MFIVMNRDVFENYFKKLYAFVVVLIAGLGTIVAGNEVDDIEFNGLQAAEDGEVGIESIPAGNDVQVVKEEYYNVMGLRIYNLDKSKLKEFYIVRSIISDGTIHSKKMYFK